MRPPRPSCQPLHVQYSFDGSRSSTTLTTPRQEHQGDGQRRGLGRGRRGAGEDAAVEARTVSFFLFFYSYILAIPPIEVAVIVSFIAEGTTNLIIGLNIFFLQNRVMDDVHIIRASTAGPLIPVKVLNVRTGPAHHRPHKKS